MSGTLHIIGTSPDKDSQVHLDCQGSPPIEVLQKAVGGYVERIRVRFEGKLRDCYVNEDGWAMGLAKNPRVTKLCSAEPIIIAGPAVIWVPDSPGETRREPEGGDNPRNSQVSWSFLVLALETAYGEHIPQSITRLCQLAADEIKFLRAAEQDKAILIPPLVDALRACLSELPDRCEHEREMGLAALARLKV